MRLLNFGSMNVDHVYQVEHFVTPGETISARKLDHFCGGKGLNQSVALACAGAETYHAGMLGKGGEELEQMLAHSGVKLDHLGVSAEMTGHAIIQVDASGQNNIIIYGGSNQAVTEEYIDSVLSHFGPEDMVLTQNEISNISYLANRCGELGIPLVFNASPITRGMLEAFPFEKVSIFLINEVEGQALTGQTEPKAILDALLTRWPHARVVLTLGQRGVVYRDSEQTFYHGAYKVKAVDTTAAGDTFTGFFLASLARGEDIPRCLENASLASALAVSRPGAAPSIPTMAEVDAARGTITPFPAP